MSELIKYAKLLKLEPGAELPEIKQKYAEWKVKIEAQMSSDDPETEKKGRNNLLLLDQAYQVLAAEATKGAKAEREQSETPTRRLATSIELDTIRTGFHIQDIEKFEIVTNRHIGHFKINWPY